MTGGAIPMWRRLPRRGFSNEPFKTTYTVINVGRLNRFADGSTVSPESLKEEGIVKQPAAGGIKVLGEGELERSLTVRAHAFSRSAAAKIESAGGAIEVIPPPKPPVRNKMRSPRQKPATEPGE